MRAGGTPQAAATATGQALEALQLDWAEHYLIGYNPEIGWWAARRHVTGHIITADGPDELRAAMADDYGPVKLPAAGGERAAAAAAPGAVLTARRREVAALVAEGLTDQQIASRLCISIRTVHAHLRAAYAKTGTGSRTQLMAWLAQQPKNEAGT
jgi:DNA-binding CsgD family transcriptional regulator